MCIEQKKSRLPLRRKNEWGSFFVHGFRGLRSAPPVATGLHPFWMRADCSARMERRLVATGENPWRKGRENHLRPNGVRESSTTMEWNNCLAFEPTDCAALIGSPPKQDMNVVGDTANFKQRPFFSANDSSQVIVNSWTYIVLQPRFTMFRAENGVEFEIMVGSGHEMSLVRRPFGAEDLYSLLFPRVPLHSTRGHQPKLLRSSDQLLQLV